MCSSIYHFHVDISSTNHIKVNGTFTTGYTNASGQLNLLWHHVYQNIPKKLQGKGQKVLLGAGWKPGVRKLGDYFTKPHLPSNHKGMQQICLHCPNIRQDNAKLCYSR